MAVARQQPEAEFIQNLLLEEGMPSTLRRTRGFDVPEMLAAGPRDVLVPAVGRRPPRARSCWRPSWSTTAGARPVQPGKVLAGLLAGVAVVALIVLLGDLLL